MGFFDWFSKLFANVKYIAPHEQIPIAPAPIVQPVPAPVIVPAPVFTKPALGPLGELTPGSLVIDLYHGDCEGKPINFPEAYAQGLICGIYHKATEASSMVDMTMVPRLKAAKIANMQIGAYHFFHGNVDGASQAMNYLKAINGVTLDMAPILDWETTDGVNRETHIVHAQEWLDTVEKATGRVPMVYMNLAQAEFLSLPASFARYPLIFARYIAAKPKAPAPWSSYVMWQKTDSGIVPGVPGGCDINLVC